MYTRRLLSVLVGSFAILTPIAGCPRAVNLAPTADAGDDKGARILAAVSLDGAGADAEGSVTFQWVQIAGPSVGQINNATSASASFTAPAIPSMLTFRLTVTDVDGAQATDDVIISVTL